MAKRKSNSLRNLIIFFTLLVLALMILAVVGKKKGWVGQPKHTKVAVEAVKKKTILQTVSASGKIYPEVEVKIASDVSGEIIELLVKEGDSIRKGQLLARIEPDIYNTAVQRAEASLNSARANAANSRAQILQLETQLDQLKRVQERNQALFNDQLISQAVLEESQSAVKSFEAQILAANEMLSGSNYGIKSAEAGVTESKKALRKTNIYAPMTGVLSTLNVEQGERVVGTAQFAGTEMMRIANFDKMELRVEVSENDVVKVSDNDKVIVEIDAYVDREFKGEVTQISNSTAAAMALTNDQVTNFTVKIRLLKESYQDLIDSGRKFVFRPGMSASAEIETQRLEDILAVPIQSVTTREIADSLQTDENRDDLLEVVFLVKGGKIQQQEVKTGIQDDTYIQIVEGLEGGESIVSAPYREISKKLEPEQNVDVVDKEELYTKKKD